MILGEIFLILDEKLSIFERFSIYFELISYIMIFFYFIHRIYYWLRKLINLG